jgi:hypothetical protein
MADEHANLVADGALPTNCPPEDCPSTRPATVAASHPGLAETRRFGVCLRLLLTIWAGDTRPGRGGHAYDGGAPEDSHHNRPR